VVQILSVSIFGTRYVLTGFVFKWKKPAIYYLSKNETHIMFIYPQVMHDGELVKGLQYHRYYEAPTM
jgi:hypothetical protein